MGCKWELVKKKKGKSHQNTSFNRQAMGICCMTQGTQTGAL